MSDNIGDSIDLGGKLPQFKAFASIAYDELNKNQLEWIRIADPKAMILDDIQYATKVAVHAYQVKWSNKDDPQPFSYQNFKLLLPDIIASWQKLRAEYAGENKPFFVHLLTNREPSAHDQVKEATGLRIGSFNRFLEEVWMKFKTNSDIDPKWQKVADEVVTFTELSKNDFDEFIKAFNIHFQYDGIDFGVSASDKEQRNTDLMKFMMFLFEKVADKTRRVLFSASDIIEQLGWKTRFQTTFNHELVVDPSMYCPVKQTMDALNKKVNQSSGGYVFLLGGPGSGKSSLLTHWIKTRKERVIRYYAFDFTAPASFSNTVERGEAITFFYDLVTQLKEHGIWPSNTILHKDKEFLKTTFAKQIELLKEEFKQTGKRTILVIDGLDHVPREYQTTLQSFIAELPAPDAFAEGIVVILGSQSYDLKGLLQSVKTAFDKKDFTVEMSFLSPKETDWYIDHSKVSLPIDEQIKAKLFELSQGHPLYLSYLINIIEETTSVDFLNQEVLLSGSIEEYYQRCWNPIKEDADLVNFLGLVARLNGDIEIDFISQWPFSDAIKKGFNKQTSFLFQKDALGWHFFHNSFRQFLITQTAFRPIDDTFDPSRHQQFHARLSEFYKNCTNNAPWQRLFHLYMGDQQKEYIEESTQQAFFEQYEAFRPEAEIESDILRGVAFAKKQNHPYLLARYIFAYNEFNSRTQLVTPASFIEEFIRIGKIGIAKQLTRNSRTLLVNNQFALRSVHWFYDAGETIEAKLIFALAEPDEVSVDGIRVQEFGHDRSKIKTLRSWASAAILFLPTEDFINSIENVVLLDDNGDELDSNKLRNSLLYEAAKTLIRKNKAEDIELVLKQLKDADFAYSRRLLSSAAGEAHNRGDDEQAREYLKRLLDISERLTLDDSGKVGLASLVHTITKNTEAAAGMLKGIVQPPVVDYQTISGDKDLGEFSERILFTKMLNLTGNEQTITQVVPDSRNTTQEPVIDFERKLCLIVKLYTDGIQGIPLTGDLGVRLSPIIRFFYGRDQRMDHRLYKLKNGASAYFTLLINAMSIYGEEKVDELIKLFANEFDKFPATWSNDVKRSIIVHGYQNGADRDFVVVKLKELEEGMLEGMDPSGRVEQCHAQAKAWIILEEAAAAEKCMHVALQASLGIGYRKDSQFSVWVDWLQRILPLDAEKAASRIELFALHLPVLRETSERSMSREAAEALLKAVLQHKIAWGFQLFIWLLNRGLIQLSAGMGAVIQALIRRTAQQAEATVLLDQYCELYLLIATDFEGNLLDEALSRGYAILPDFLGNGLVRLIEAIRINALPENRERYYSRIKTFLERNSLPVSSLTGLIDPRKVPEKQTTQNNLLLQEGHQSVAEAEVMAMVTDARSFIDLYRKEDKANSYFSWKNVFNKIQHPLTERDLREILSQCNLGRRDSELLQQLTDKALNLNLPKLAQELAVQALANSSPSGWISGYDGGSRLVACKAMIAADPVTGYKRSLETLADDVMESNYISEFHKSFDDILPVITEHPDDQKIWPEIESYLTRLLIAEPGDSIPAFNEMSDEEVLSDFICLLSQFTNRGMHGIMTKIVARHLPSIKLLGEKLQSFAAKNHDHQRFLIDVLNECAFHQAELVTATFKEPLQILASSQNAFIRRDAITLLEKLSEDDVPVPVAKELPAIYNLNIPVNQLLKKSKGLAGDSVVKDTENIIDLLGGFSQWLGILVDATSFSKGAIAQRWRQLIENEGWEQTTAAFEEKVRSHIKEIDLEFFFPRPRYQVIKHALGRLIAEFSDAGIDGFEDAVAQYDFLDTQLMARLKVSHRPEWIIPMQEGRMFLSGWVNEISSSGRLEYTATRTADGWVVAGEHTTLINLSHGKPTETIVTYMAFGGSLTNEEDDPPMAQTFRGMYEDYYEDLVVDSHQCVVVYNYQDFRSPGKSGEWIAFNPIIAQQLGWKPSEKEMFGWDNDTGELMAFSRYWRDGNIEMNVPRYDNEVGEGWYALISEKALAQLKAIRSPFFSLRRKITRETTYQGYDSDSFNQIINEWE